ncbi:alpha-2-macroglobulin family protein [Mangrovicella endophytica]|uniref:alpha-2-macroglobulin family protein n=1 Tax=Mangrovicella endophytica TaxID=2066697 RepID=UPI001FDF564B|nr:alpha-2-macroglobulin family protein [Mangrovicella endophytica]
MTRLTGKFLAMAVLVAAMLPGGAATMFGGEATAAERRIIQSKDADMFGKDYDVLKDVDLNLCETACLSDNRCQAYTLNTKSNWCFLKEDVGELRAAKNAISGKVVIAEEIDEAAADTRAAELGFVESSAVEEAKRLRLAIADEEKDSSFDASSPEVIAATATAALSYPDALRIWREALKRNPLDANAWRGTAEAALNNNPDDYEEKSQNDTLRLSASINAYVTAETEEDRAAASRLIGRAFEAGENWKPAIKAYRQSLALADTGDTRALLDAAVAAHGFRITENTVDNNAANPRICLTFSDALAPSLINSETAGDFIAVDGGETLPVSAAGSQICVDGVKHGERYRIVARAGIASADGEKLTKPADISVYVRDRDPSVRFSTNAYVLPAGGEATIPVTTINTAKVEARLQRIGDRELARTIGESRFLRQLSSWEVDAVAESQGTDVWRGSVEVAEETNAEVTTAVPVSAMVKDLQPGVYLLSAKAENAKADSESVATQWFIVTDIGLTTFGAEDGFHVFARSLGEAQELEGVELQLVATNNQILATERTDASGHARFPAGLLRGTGGNRPAVLTASAAGTGSDFVFLDLTASAFDLTDRGVEGRPPAGALDVFLTSERGIYRTGDTAYLTGTVRNAQGQAVEGLTLTGIVKRPDGVEFQRRQIADAGAGGFDWPVDLPANAMRGTWTVALFTDPKRPALAQTTIRVEDFEPEKIDFDVATDATSLDPAAPPAVSVDARYLFGAPATGLEASGEVVLTSSDVIEGFPGVQFGLATDEATATRLPFTATTTDEEGKASVTLDPFEPPATTKPLQAALQVRVVDAGGRPVERSLDLPLSGGSARLGIKPLFEGAVGERSNAGFDVVAIGADRQRVAVSGASWVLNKIDTRFQWYSTSGSWNYEPIRTSARVASGTLDIAADKAAPLSLPVDWGEYELVLKDPAGVALPASVSFEAGWYVATKALDTPDVARVSLDKPRYKIGETATVHIEPRFAGRAEVLVMDERVIATKTADIPAEGGDVTLEVTRDWGPGAYIAAVVYRPMSIADKRMPGRAIGLTHASVDPGERALTVSLTAPDKIEPRRKVDIGIDIAGITAGETAYVTLAAVDVGILNITSFEPPSLSGFYFGKRKLGVEIRDLYGRLIDRMQGAAGTVRSGGDAGASYDTPPPMDELVALYSGVLTADADGHVTASFDIPDFNGTLKLMALAWSKTGVGEANAEMTVRDPVVIAVSRPRFLAPGDRSRIAVDMTHVDGPSGAATLSLKTEDGFARIDANADAPVELADKGHSRVLIPVTAEAVGDARFDLSFEMAGGETLTKSFTVPVRSIAPETVTKSRLEMAANGGTLSLGPDVFADFMPGTGSATLSVTGAAEFDIAGVVRSLDRYPYGCTEQLTSRALPLVYLDRTVVQAGLGRDQDVRERVDKAIAGVLANQASNGSFGLWQPESGDLWLDAYVTDFLTRAREAGYKVPDEGLQLAVDNLRNTLSYLPEQPDWGPVAYAYYVLARNGRAAIGDLRYYADNELPNFKTPIAKAQLGAALALYGDRMRAEQVFRSAVSDVENAGRVREDRSDYGTQLRDSAAILTLGLETKIDGVGLDGLVQQVNFARAAQPRTSTQEDAWSLLAAHALLGRNPPKLTVDGQDIDGPYSAEFDEAALAQTAAIANRDSVPVTAAVTLRGVPKVAPPASANGYEITRRYYTLEGEEADAANIAQGDRLVTVLEVTPVDEGAARLILNDPLPAGLEIDNPAILRGGDVAALDWLELTGDAAHTEFRAERFIAAIDKARGDTAVRRYAYIVRAVSPGSFVHPAAVVEDMYNPDRRGQTDEGQVSVVGPLQ